MDNSARTLLSLAIGGYAPTEPLDAVLDVYDGAAHHDAGLCKQCGGDGVVETQTGRYGEGEIIVVRCRWCHGTGSALARDARFERPLGVDPSAAAPSEPATRECPGCKWCSPDPYSVSDFSLDGCDGTGRIPAVTR